ncbi:hypothetical protein D1159_03840 [Pseudoflavonifractor sp. 524-17]|uniref:hypothetical protein n=1 Tax=Pseudoflavonifractor sp. 524-17 TaxID=2304577 RepID=UPI00137B8180|nr:hypothetical protein [Pseudoflavonifractor sp. 524-17]NCE63731.1 hypothetical protein [Pseudoflavonifractor sp. 524-17]
MLEQVLTHIHNWFQVGIYRGTYIIQDGGITLPFLKDGQYFRITGSVFNDGLHRYGPEMELLQDETFDGSIWSLAIPKSVVNLAAEIAAWKEKYGAVIDSPYTSESFGGYSYSKASGAGDSTGSGGWQAAFRARLNPYRKLREI